MPKTPKKDLLAGHVRGYPKLAKHMGVHPESAIFRRFGALNARNLLYLQAELTALENALKEAETKDAESGQGQKHLYARDWFWLELSGREMNGDSLQLNLMMKVREKLKEYSTSTISRQKHKTHVLNSQDETLYYYTCVQRLEHPDWFDMKDIQQFLGGPEMERPLLGPDMDVWGDVSDPKSYVDDGLVALRPRERTDRFTSAVSERAISVIHLFNRLIKGRKATVVTLGYTDSTVTRITFWLTSFIASGIPVVCIIALMNLDSVTARLGAIAGFNGLIGLCLLAFTDAKRIDVFSITAAYANFSTQMTSPEADICCRFAAVQVVFVGQALETVTPGGSNGSKRAVTRATCLC